MLTLGVNYLEFWNCFEWVHLVFSLRHMKPRDTCSNFAQEDWNACQILSLFTPFFKYYLHDDSIFSMCYAENFLKIWYGMAFTCVVLGTTWTRRNARNTGRKWFTSKFWEIYIKVNDVKIWIQLGVNDSSSPSENVNVKSAIKLMILAMH